MDSVIIAEVEAGKQAVVAVADKAKGGGSRQLILVA